MDCKNAEMEFDFSGVHIDVSKIFNPYEKVRITFNSDVNCNIVSICLAKEDLRKLIKDLIDIEKKL